MAALDISSLFFTEDLLDEHYEKLDIDEEAKVKYIDAGHPLDYAYRSPNQITTIKTKDNHVNQRVLTYDSAQNYFQSEKAMILKGPELAEKVRVSKKPYEDAYVSVEDFKNNIEEWEENQFDVAFKCNWLKFTQNKDLADELLRTGKRPIVAREDTDWSEINAKILMIIREDLRQRKADN